MPSRRSPRRISVWATTRRASRSWRTSSRWPRPPTTSGDRVRPAPTSASSSAGDDSTRYATTYTGRTAQAGGPRGPWVASALLLQRPLLHSWHSLTWGLWRAQMAVTNFVRHYEISRDMVQSSQGSMAQLEQARVYLGIARVSAPCTIHRPYDRTEMHRTSSLLSSLRQDPHPHWTEARAVPCSCIAVPACVDAWP